MDYSTPGFPVHHQLPELAQTHTHWVSDATNHLILCRPLLLPPSIFPSVRVFSSESVLCIRWPKYWSFSFSISPSNRLVLFHSVQLLSHVQLFATLWTTARQASLSITIFWSLLKLMSIESVCHLAISSSVIPFSSHLQSFPVSGSFQTSCFFASGGQSIGVAAWKSVLPMLLSNDK